MNDATYAPPDSYGPHLTKIRTPAQRAFIEARDQLIEARAAAQPHGQQNDNDDPPCPYCAPVAALRAATQAPESQFEERWRNMRRRQLEREQSQLDADAPDEIRALAAHEIAADLADYEAPNSYAEALSKLRSTR